MKKTLPIFYDHSSMKSILTWWSEKDTKENGPQSILSCAAEGDFKQVVFVSKNWSTFLEAHKACESKNIKLIFGIELIMCDDALIHSPETRQNEHKIIIFAKNSQGRKDLMKIYSACHSNPENKYYVMRFDENQLRLLWTENLHLCIPFFDGFAARNALTHKANIIVDFSYAKNGRTILIERGSEHPLEDCILSSISKFNSSQNWPTEDCKTIYYRKKSDLKAYMTYRAIQNRGTFSCPDIDFFCSDKFCFESWKEISAL